MVILSEDEPFNILKLLLNFGGLEPRYLYELCFACQSQRVAILI